MLKNESIIDCKIHCKMSKALTKVRIAVVPNKSLCDPLTDEDITLAHRKHWIDYSR